MLKISPVLPLRINNTYTGLDNHFYIQDAEGKVYHHKDGIWRFKPLKNINAYCYDYSVDADRKIKQLIANTSISELSQALDPYCKDRYMSDIFEALELIDTRGYIQNEAITYLENEGFTIVPKLSIIEQMKLEEFISTLNPMYEP